MGKKEFWEHPELGRFEFDFTGWTRKFDFLAFEAFKFRERQRYKGLQELPLSFLVEDENTDQHPSRRAIAVAQRVIKNQHLLADRLINAVWKDLHGKGRDTGMWWHGDLRTINESIAEASRDRTPLQLEKPDDLYDLLGAFEVQIRETRYQYEKPSAELCFECAWEIEHRLGVLTDGTRIRGIGYQYDVGPYR